MGGYSIVIGKTIAHYKIVDLLGEGGMGKVYLAEDSQLGRRVALKLLPPEMADDPERLQRFEREARTVAALNHPSIVTIYSVEESDYGRFIAMELVEGETLDQRIPSDGFTLDEFFKIAVPLADALSAAHRGGVTHRDLKPANVMVSTDDRIKVLDFGLAKLHQNPGDGPNQDVTQSITRAGMVMGTVPYMSPEQLQGQPADPRSDLFSIGVMFHEMLTGNRPFQGASSAELVSSILRDAPPVLTDLKAELPSQLGRILRRCMEKDADRRFQSALDLRNELEDIQKEARKEKAQSGPSVAILPFQDLSPDRDQDYFCEGIAEELINALHKIENLRVASRATSFQLQKSGASIEEIAKHLNVNTVLGGSVRKAGNRLRISGQLTNVADGSLMWSDRFDREMKDVFAIQDEIAESIAAALEVTLSPKERRAIQNVATRDVEAYEFYLRGRKFFYKLDRKNFEHARMMFSRAIEIDSAYALAYAGIADCCSFLFMYAEASDDNRDQADKASRKALELDSELGEAHASRGLSLSLSKKYEASQKAFETAIEHNPKLFEAYYFYGRDCLAQGRHEKAAELFAKAIETRPGDYQSAQMLTMAMKGAGASKEELQVAHHSAIEAVENHIRLNPDDARALYLGGSALVQVGQREKGLEWGRRALRTDPNEPAILYNVACLFAVADEVDEAFEYLDRAITAGFGYRAWLENDSDFDGMRDDSRFADLIGRLA